MDASFSKRANGFAIVTGAAETYKRYELSKGDVRIIFSGEAITVIYGDISIVDQVSFGDIENGATLAPFGSIPELKAFCKEVFFNRNSGAYQFSEIVAATAGSGHWVAFEDSPCDDLQMQNFSGVDLYWHKGDSTRFLILKTGEIARISGITNANQVFVKLASGDEKTVTAESITI